MDSSPISPCGAGMPTDQETCTTSGGRCTFCGRTTSDIIQWGSMSKKQRLERLNAIDDKGLLPDDFEY